MKPRVVQGEAAKGRARGRAVLVAFIAAVGAACTMTGCGGVPTASLTVERAGTPRAALSAGLVRAARDAGASFDPPAAERGVRPGDRVMYGIEVRESGEVTALRLLTLEAMADPARPGSVLASDRGDELTVTATDSAGTRRVAFDSDALAVRFVLLDVEQGAAVPSAEWTRGASGTIHMAEMFLRHGIFDQAAMRLELGRRSGRGPRAPGTPLPAGAKPNTTASSERVSDEELARVWLGGYSLYAFADLFREGAPLEELAWEVVEKPSVLSVVLSVGVRATTEFDGDAEAAGFVPGEELGAGVSSAAEPLAAYRQQIVVRINGAESLRCEAVAVECVPPYQLGAGLVAFEAWKPSEPATRVVVRLLGAKRGDR